jgi:hypothetical protein
MATQTTEKLLTAEESYRLPDPPHGGRMDLRAWLTSASIRIRRNGWRGLSAR